VRSLDQVRQIGLWKGNGKTGGKIQGECAEVSGNDKMSLLLGKLANNPVIAGIREPAAVKMAVTKGMQVFFILGGDSSGFEFYGFCH